MFHSIFLIVLTICNHTREKYIKKCVSPKERHPNYYALLGGSIYTTHLMRYLCHVVWHIIVHYWIVWPHKICCFDWLMYFISYWDTLLLIRMRFSRCYIFRNDNVVCIVGSDQVFKFDLWSIVLIKWTQVNGVTRSRIVIKLNSNATELTWYL